MFLFTYIMGARLTYLYSKTATHSIPKDKIGPEYGVNIRKGKEIRKSNVFLATLFSRNVKKIYRTSLKTINSSFNGSIPSFEPASSQQWTNKLTAKAIKPIFIKSLISKNLNWSFIVARVIRATLYLLLLRSVFY